MFKNVLTKMAYVVLVSLLAINMYLIVSKFIQGKKVVTILGVHNALIVSGSMSPTLEVNDLVFYKLQEQYEVGDIVIYKQGEIFITHRIIALLDGGFQTRGDANTSADKELVDPSQIYGKCVFKITFLDDCILFFTHPLGIMVCISLVIVTINFRKKGVRYDEN